MKYLLRTLATLSALLSSHSLALAQDVEPSGTMRFGPSTPWVVDYGETKCTLRRLFEHDGRELQLDVIRTVPGGELSFAVFSKDIEPTRHPASVRFSPEGEHAQAQYSFSAGLIGGGHALVFYETRVEPKPDSETRELIIIEPAAEDTIRMIDVREAFKPGIVIETGELAEPLAALEKCNDDLLAHWGIDVTAHKALSRQAQPKRLKNWAKRLQEAYPLGPAIAGLGGRIPLVLIVSENGLVEDCHVVVPIPAKAFEKTSCQKLQRYARFEPALDAAGEPVRSYWKTQVVYQIN